jgi:hypothetical protein
MRGVPLLRCVPSKHRDPPMRRIPLERQALLTRRTRAGASGRKTPSWRPTVPP